MLGYKALQVMKKYNEITMITLQDPKWSNLQPISSSLDTQLDKNTKKNPHLYPQVHQETL